MKTSVRCDNGDIISIEPMKLANELILKIRQANGQEATAFLTIDQAGVLSSGLEYSAEEIQTRQACQRAEQVGNLFKGHGLRMAA